MSFVGPRPLLVKYLPFYNKYQRQRHKVRPGLTGFAQVNGRNAISWEEMFNYDIEYVDNVSLSLDIRLMFLTLWKIIFKESIELKEREDFGGK